MHFCHLFNPSYLAHHIIIHFAAAAAAAASAFFFFQVLLSYFHCYCNSSLSTIQYPFVSQVLLDYAL